MSLIFMDECTFVAVVRKDGERGKKIAVTLPAKLMELKLGDAVEVTIKKKE